MLLWGYFAGQVANAISEECVFRGLVLPQLMRGMPFWKANMVQAALFAVAHLVWPFSSWALGQATAQQALEQSGTLLAFTWVGGLVFGYVYYRTNNLWAAIGAHLLDNCIGLFIHIGATHMGSTRVNAELDVSLVARVVFLSLVLVAFLVARQAKLAPLGRWGEAPSVSG